MDETTLKELKKTAAELRKTAVTMVYHAQSGHPGGSLSAADFMAALYFYKMNLDPENPEWEDRDRFVLSKGHVAPILYSALTLRGYYPEEKIYTLREYKSPFQGHPDSKKAPGVDISTGSLGQGLSTAVGMALGAKMDDKDFRVFSVLGDGEINEGQIWEASMTASKYQLDNLIVILDENGLQIDGPTEEIMPNLDIAKKFDAFGFDVKKIDGHNMEEIVKTLDEVTEEKNGKPKMIVANTIKGKGVSYMEHEVGWHGKAPNEEEYNLAMEELDREADRFD